MRIPSIKHAFFKALWPARVRNQLVLGVALVHLILMTVFIFDLIERQRIFLYAQDLEKAKSLAGALAANSTSWVIANDVVGLSELVGHMPGYHVLCHAMVVDTEGMVLAHTDRSLIGMYLKDDLSRSFLKAEPKIHVLHDNPHNLDVASPVLTDTGDCIGWVLLLHNREHVGKSLRHIYRNGIIYTLLAILTGSIFAMLIGGRLTSDLNRLIAFAADIKKGSHGLRLDIPSGYEVGKLSEGFNQMLDAIEARGKENADLRHILDNMAEGCLIIGFDWTYHYVNAAAAGQRFKSREELLGRAVTEVYPGMEESRIFKAYRRCMQERIRLRFEAGHTFKEGHPRWYELSIEPVTDGIFVLFLDITERKRSEKELAESEKKYRRLIETLNEGIWMIDAMARTTYVNLRMAEMLGRTVEEMMGKELFDFMDEKGVEMARLNIEHRKSGIREQHDFEFIKKDGTRMYAILETTPITDDAGNYAGALAAVADMTDRKEMQKDLELARTLNIRTEELKQANIKLKEVDRLKSMFIASMSHELRTPLNSIIGFSSILLKEWCGAINAEQQENLSTILAAGRHLHMLIDEVIDVSKIEAGIHENVVESFDIYDLITEALAIIKSEKGGGGLKFSAIAGHQILRTDRRRLFQCLINLLSNAAKFTLKGEVTIKAETVKNPDDPAAADIAEITVTDTGIGIKEEDLPRLFSPFVRLTSPLTDKTKGSGLGLYLVRKIAAEILKGEVFVDSVHGKGSSFGLRIPVRLEQEK
ncbi:MAG TPA: hypothetical protein DCS63_07355 [Elusimicrobia bacterium]|nr:hypothetical protein [Elusimicrobiota bacterium]